VEGTPIIDLHCHAAGIGSGGSDCFVAEGLRQSWKYSFYLRAFGVTDDELTEQGDALLIRRLSERLGKSRLVTAAVVLALDGVIGRDGKLDPKQTELFIPNEFIATGARRHPNLLFGASINPFRPDALERLEQARADGAVLVKWLPSIQHIDPADRQHIPFYRQLQKLGLPLLSHTGKENSFTRARDELSDPARLRLPLEEGLTVIAAHGATDGTSDGVPNFTRILPLFADFPNLYADISSLTQLNKLGHLNRLLSHRELHGRLLYGTDMPLPCTGIVSPFFFASQLSLRQMVELQRIRNPWDRDVLLKQALGVPAEVFTATARLLNLPSHRTASMHDKEGPIP